MLINWRDPWHGSAGGAERYAWEVARGLVEAGAQVEFLTSRDDGQSARSEIDGIVVRRSGGTFGFYPRTLLALLHRRRHLDFVIDVENGIPSFAPLVLRRRTPVVLVMHHVHLDQFRRHFSALPAVVGRFLEGRVMPRVYRSARAIAVSESTRDQMQQRLGWAGRVDVVHNGADGGLVMPAAPEPRRVAVLGRLVAHKRVDAVVRAAAELRDAGRPVQVDIIGRGPMLDELRALVTQLDVDDQVHFHGFVDEHTKASLLARAQVHVCASEGEGWGQVVLEAATSGVPTLAYDVPGLRDSIIADRTGWLLESTEPLAAALDRCLDEVAEPHSSAAIALECRRWAEKFDWATARAAFVDLVRAEVSR